MKIQSPPRISEFFLLISAVVNSLLVSQISATSEPFQVPNRDTAHVSHIDKSRDFPVQIHQLPSTRRRAARYEMVSGKGAQDDHPLAMGSQFEVKVVRLLNSPPLLHEKQANIENKTLDNTMRRNERKVNKEKRYKNAKNKRVRVRKNRKRNNLRKSKKTKNQKKKKRGKGKKSERRKKDRKRLRKERRKKAKKQEKHSETNADHRSKEAATELANEVLVPCSVLHVTEMTRDICEGRPSKAPDYDPRFPATDMGDTHEATKSFVSVDCPIFLTGQVRCDPLTMTLPSLGVNVTLACIPVILKRVTIVQNTQD